LFVGDSNERAPGKALRSPYGIEVKLVKPRGEQGREREEIKKKRGEREIERQNPYLLALSKSIERTMETGAKNYLHRETG